MKEATAFKPCSTLRTDKSRKGLIILKQLIIKQILLPLTRIYIRLKKGLSRQKIALKRRVPLAILL